MAEEELCMYWYPKEFFFQQTFCFSEGFFKKQSSMSLLGNDQSKFNSKMLLSVEKFVANNNKK